MRFLRCVHAEWSLVPPRLTRTRLGVSLLALAAALIWLHGRGLDFLTVTMQAGALGSIVGAAAAAGSEAERAALSVALTHPTTGLAIATGRWVAAVVPAAVITVACAIAVGWHAAAVVAGVAAAAAVGACALALVLVGGKGAAAMLFLFMAVAGAIAPERLVDLAHPGLVRLAAASALELGPALWHYRDITSAEPGAILHAIAWTVLGILLSGGLVARRR